jgi:hypothetical protein
VSSALTIIRVRLPDRPGALGLVASRIGALKGDIVGVEVIDRTDGVAVDEFAVVLPEDFALATVGREIAEVDGATLESVLVVDDFPEPRLDALLAAQDLVRARDERQLATALVDQVQRLVRPEWSAVAIAGAVIADASSPASDVGGVAARATATFAIGPDRRLHLGRTQPLSAGEHRLVTAACDLADELSIRW